MRSLNRCLASALWSLVIIVMETSFVLGTDLQWPTELTWDGGFEPFTRERVSRLRASVIFYSRVSRAAKTRDTKRTRLKEITLEFLYLPPSELTVYISRSDHSLSRAPALVWHCYFIRDISSLECLNMADSRGGKNIPTVDVSWNKSHTSPTPEKIS